ncbi:P-loop NTPase [Phycicoccus endophyticus]|uniref:P-loop NTPase n=1 Tax=Phycicoccus endophyticus TaxID=1690220 RepID=A0A7G9R368_9MICO|nr:P-loop NTPase [Phycicoccus endophyticus]NHI19782.1 P-loop NTPase [Phycicoccus endophyticus]QNN50043.1 P-loop NTPase [Phycicoccus endophyticus]GGL28639.1 pilus biosynthesis protein CpaE [Phycicoccus endophyticus]
MTTVVTALTHRHEARFVEVVGAAAEVTLVRRCADLPELLSTGAAGVARVAVVSPDLRGLDRDALRHLAGHGVRVAGLAAPEDEDGERRLRQLGVASVLHPDDDAATVAAVLGGLAEATTSRPLGPAAASTGEVEEEPEAPRAPTPVTVVWGPTGAPGRTTVAVTLAATLARAGIRTLLVDLDTWGASVAQLLGLVDEAPGVAAAARASEQGLLDVPGLARLAPEALPRLRVLTGLPRADRWPELRPAAVEDVLRLARGIVDHVVVDTGFALEEDEELSYDTAAPRRNAATLTALEAADRLVVVGAADPVGLQRLVRGVQDLAVRPAPPPTVLVNKVRASAAGPRPERTIREVLGRFAGLEEVRLLPWAPEDCDEAVLTGRALTEVRPRSPLLTQVAALAADLDERCVGAPTAGRHGTRRRARV